MKLSALFEGFTQNAYFQVNEPLDVWVSTPSRGAGMVSKKKHRLNAGDQLHWLHGGMFAVQDGGDTTYRGVSLSDPNSHTEAQYHAYRNNPTGFVAKQLADLVQDDVIDEISGDAVADRNPKAVN